MDDHQLSTLFDYTKFHIGLYSTLITGLFAIIAFAMHPSDPNGKVLAYLLPYAKFTAGFILVAGAAGGVIASNIPNYKTFEEYKSVRLPIFGIPSFTYFVFAHVEHLAFWIAVGIASYACLSIPLNVKP